MIAHTAMGETPCRRSRKLKELINNGEVQWGGNKKLKVYGTLNCASGKRMKVGNRVFFRSEQEAKEMGFRPCAHCMRQAYLLWKADSYI
ncbi:Ada metal-binding domain-containing protein [Mucilaginibacter sp.]|uniref:Ada metal-binding domain-containing protein n=1 Tax=Mucilaginibacter sp. TaxID=1882438 RepID=UPI002D80D938|nr:Ada metal-binding domain-containing protein [Mucilaginibacter sp.]